METMCCHSRRHMSELKILLCTIPADDSLRSPQLAPYSFESADHHTSAKQVESLDLLCTDGIKFSIRPPQCILYSSGIHYAARGLHTALIKLPCGSRTIVVVIMF
jgi:hypothetical protein